MSSTSLPVAVGITGGIGAGKSTIARIFSILGIPIYEADSRAKWLISNSQSLKSQIISHFGEQSFQDGSLNRSYLARKVFSDQQQTELLNSLVHPEVAKDFDHWMNIQKSAYVLKEAALLYETGSYNNLYKTILVSASDQIRINRVLKRDPHRTEADIKNIISRQWSEERKAALCEFTIQNNGTELTIPQVLAIHNQLMSEINR